MSYLGYDFPHTRNQDSDLTQIIEMYYTLKGLPQSFDDLKKYVNTYFDDLDVQKEIDSKLDKMAEDGTLSAILANTATYKPPIYYNIKSGDDISNVLGNLTDNIGLSSGEYFVTKDTTVNASVVFADGAIINVSDGVTLLFNVEIIAGRYHIFSGNGVVRFLYGSNNVYPEWFGAVNDGETDCKIAFDKAKNSITRGLISLAPGVREYDSETNKWFSTVGYYLSSPFELNREFVRLGCLTGLSCLIGDSSTILKIGTGRTDKWIEGLSAFNIQIVSKIDSPSALDIDDKNSYAVQFVGINGGEFKKIRVFGIQNAFYFRYCTSASFEQLTSVPAIGATYTQGRAFFLDGQSRLTSLYFDKCGATASANDTVAYTGFYATGNTNQGLRDLFIRDFETANCDIGMHILAQAGSTANNISIVRAILDQNWRKALIIDINATNTGEVRLSDCYFQTRSNNEDCSIYIKTKTGEPISFNNCVFHDEKSERPTLQATDGSVLQLIGCVFKDCFYAIDCYDIGVHIIGCLFENYDTDIVDSFINIEKSAGCIAFCDFYNASGVSTTNKGIINNTQSDNSIIGNSFRGYYGSEISGADQSRLVINAGTASQNKIPGFTHN